jgi:phosphate transport system substrate-binding protein
MDQHENADIQVSGGGSSVGIQSAGEGTADIGMASRQIKDSETDEYPDLVEHVVAKDGIAIILHTSNSISRLSTAQLKSIYKGEYTNWKDIGGPETEIVVVGRDTASGTREFFHDHVMNKEDFVSGMLEKASNAGVLEAVKGTEGAIGYVGLGYVDETVKAVKIDGVDPTVANVISGDYPVSRSLYMYTQGEPDGLAKEFLDFIKSSDGQEIVEQEGFVPLSGSGGGGSGVQTISITGSTTVLPISSNCAEAYMDAHDNVDIQVSGGGSSVGIRAAGEGTADIGMASRQIKDSERDKYPNLVERVVARDGIAIIVHTSNSITDLSTAQLKSIYKGEHTNWKDLGGPDAQIVVVGRDTASGTREFFHDHVMNKEDFVSGMLEKASNAGVLETVQDTEGAIGFVGLGYVDETVKAVKIDGVDPTVANVISGDYPVSRALYMYTDGQPTGLAGDFIDFILSSEGQAIVEEEGFVPLQ